MFSRRPRRLNIAVRNRGVFAAEDAAANSLLPLALASPLLFLFLPPKARPVDAQLPGRLQLNGRFFRGTDAAVPTRSLLRPRRPQKRTRRPREDGCRDACGDRMERLQ
jgi:hypothetical protein